MKVLFQGDSITDWGRAREDYHNLGDGYPKFAAEAIKNRHPDTEFEFINLGISGNKVNDLVDRWQSDCIDIAPDVVSILIGVNDVWHRAADKSWLPTDEFEAQYRFILDEIKSKTKAKIIMLEPYLTYVPDKAFFREDLAPKIEAVRSLAREYADYYIPLDGIFASASVQSEPTLWAYDGVHPTEAGAHLIAKHYADAFDLIFASVK